MVDHNQKDSNESNKESKKKKPKIPIDKFTLASLIIVIIILALVGYYYISMQVVYNESNVDNAVITPLGSNENGNVVKMGPYGNASSNMKVAFIVGVHSEDQKSEDLLTKALVERNDLKSCYYVYKINVSDTQSSQTRLKGELLANQYAVPEIQQNNYNVVVNVHYMLNSHSFIKSILSVFGQDSFQSGNSSSNATDTSDIHKYILDPINNAGGHAIDYGIYYSNDDINSTQSNTRTFVNFFDSWNLNGPQKETPY